MLKMVKSDLKILFLLFVFYHVEGVRLQTSSRLSSETTFNVKTYGAKANRYTDDTKAFLDTWDAACKSSGDVKVVVPKSTYFLSEIQFRGPCPEVQTLTFQLEGTLMASTDLNKYKTTQWVEFGWTNNLIITGGGTFDGQGAVSWPFNKCPKQKNCKTLPNNLLFVNSNHTVVKDVKSLNSKFFHIAILNCNGFEANNIQISAPATSPNTDGIHIERSSGVTIKSSKIGTGDDCVSVGHGNSQITIDSITCGPGHGISVGSLGRYKEEGDVSGLTVKNCKLTGTDNGVRIKTWENSPVSTSAGNMTFENIVMTNVLNPIIIDQTYCPFSHCDKTAPSRVKLSNIKFNNIRGTTTSPVAVTLQCSKGFPCEKVSLHNVNLQYIGTGKQVKSTARCMNVQATYSGTQIPPPCS